MKRTTQWMIASLCTIFILSGCGKETSAPSSEHADHSSATSSSSSSTTMSMASSEDHSMHSGHNHSGTVPTEMHAAHAPKFPVGSQVVVQTDHMPGMENAEAQVVGAYDTTIYEVSYQPTDGSAEVKNHKWVVQEELQDQSEPAAAGDEVTLAAEHMAGMQGAKATVDEAITGTVYVIDYEATDGSGPVKNHMWVTEDELTAAE